jgi:two-component system, NarL family, sensor histidine kinase DevS
MRGVERDAESLERLLAVGRRLVETLDLELVLPRVLAAARDLTGASYAALGILSASGDGLERFLAVGIDDRTRAEIGDPPRGRGVLGVLIDDPRPLRLRSVGEHPRSYGFPLGHPRMESFLGVPVMIGDAVFGNLYLTDKRGADEFSLEDEHTLMALADWAAVAIANARSLGSIRDERDELVRAVAAFETAAAIAEALAGESELDRILELVAKRARALVHARMMVVALREGEELVVRAVSGDTEQELVGLRTALGDSLSGHVTRAGGPRRLSDAPPDTAALLPSVARADTALIVPMRFRGHRLGVLTALDRLEHGPDFTSDDERLMLAFAASAATAVATARDFAAEARRRSMRAAESERGRWARELHDETLQDLAGLNVMLARARKLAAEGELRELLGRAAEQAQLSITGLRGLITELRPAALDELGVAAALQTLVGRVRSVTGLEIDLRLDRAYERGGPERRHERELESAIYRLVQESLTNVAKHARAESVSVEVAERDGGVAITVSDDGEGFDTTAASDGFGLLGMRERVGLLGGELEIDSAAGQGTTIVIRLPARGRPVAPEAA